MPGNSKPYEQMTIAEILQAASVEKDPGAIAYWDKIMQAQIGQFQSFEQTHDMSLYTRITRPFLNELAEAYRQFKQPAESALESIASLLPSFDILREISASMDEYLKSHAEAIEAITKKDDSAFSSFCASLTVGDFKQGLRMSLTAEQRSEFEADKKGFFLSLPMADCIALYEYKNNITVRVKTRQPRTFITPVDKVSNKAFVGAFDDQVALPVAVERRGSKKKIDTIVSINFEELDEKGVQISNARSLTAYDREVHDAILTLYVDGENSYVTGAMIYQAMVGNPKATLNPKQAEAISNSVTKLMYTRLTIDATQEAQAYGFEKFKYSGYLLPAERVTAAINGNITECLHLFRSPPLYDYAGRKKQVGRVDIKLLNSPLNKNDETISLQGYLRRRILAMKNNPKLSPSIVYETVYEALKISAPTDGALRKKKLDVRKKIKTILDYWKDESFILGYVENTRKTESYSVTIRL